ncbi:Fis family transcriptional regulator [Thauera sp. JM12B12]|uniref:Fis family transcriptional regulator n=1 Tax=Thauera sp. JM12B12 TaxID=3142262 RepID=UPI0031F43F3D
MNTLTFPGFPASPRGASASDGQTPVTGTPTASSAEIERLVALAAPAMEELYRQLDSPSITVLLADSRGSVLRAIGSGADGAAEGAACAGRGAAPAGRQPPASRAALPARPRVPPRRIGIAAPILPPGGGLLGFVDADASPLDWLGHANALVQTAARLIEHRLIESAPRGFLLLRFHRYPAVLGTPLEALALFDPEGSVLLANRVAIELLAPCPFGCGVAAANCFATQWCGIVGYAALGLRQPFTLRDRRGSGYSACASLTRAAA